MTTQSMIPFNRPYLVGTEAERMKSALEGSGLSEGGLSTERCERLLERISEARRVLLTTSCTHALEMAALLLDLGPGDEVVVPSFTFVSTANAVALRGARPVFADIRPDTLNLDERRLEEHLTPRTRAIIVVHYGGVGCEMDAIGETASRAGIPIVEDNAHGLMGRYKGKALGTFGRLATQSFHETKNLTCGKGGALLLNDVGLESRARSIRTKGTNRHEFFEGLVDKYTWVELGSSYMPLELLSVFLRCQLEAVGEIQAMRRRIWDGYHSALQPWADSQGVLRPTVPAHAAQAYHLYYLILPTHDDRQRLIEHMRGRGVLGVFHYVPLHLSRIGRGLGGREGDCPVTEDRSARLVRLPFFTGMTPLEQERVIEVVTDFRCD